MHFKKRVLAAILDRSQGIPGDSSAGAAKNCRVLQINFFCYCEKSSPFSLHNKRSVEGGKKAN